MLDHGEKIVDTLGSEVDRIEKGLKVGSVGVYNHFLRNRFLNLFCFQCIHSSPLLLNFLSFTVMLQRIR